MKRINFYLFAILLLLALIIGVYVFKNEQQKPIREIYQERDIPRNNIESIPSPSKLIQERTGHQLNAFVYEISREICEQEKKAVQEIVYPASKDLKPGDMVPESNVVLSPTQAIELLKRTTNSKCSSFRKDSIEQFFSESVLNQENYAAVYSNFFRVLNQVSGFDTDRLIKKALEAFDDASLEEKKTLQNMILYSLKTYINDASTFMDIGGASNALKNVVEKGLISYAMVQQIDEIRKRLIEMSENFIKEGQRFNKKYFPPDTDFLKLTDAEIINMQGYQGIKETLERERKSFQGVRELSQQLNTLLDKNF